MLVAQRRKGPSFIIRDFTDFFFLLDFDLAEYYLSTILFTVSGIFPEQPGFLPFLLQ
jgi:hypothetical protein